VAVSLTRVEELEVVALFTQARRFVACLTIRISRARRGGCNGSCGGRSGNAGISAKKSDVEVHHEETDLLDRSAIPSSGRLDHRNGEATVARGLAERSTQGEVIGGRRASDHQVNSDAVDFRGGAHVDLVRSTTVLFAPGTLRLVAIDTTIYRRDNRGNRGGRDDSPARARHAASDAVRRAERFCARLALYRHGRGASGRHSHRCCGGGGNGGGDTIGQQPKVHVQGDNRCLLHGIALALGPSLDEFNEEILGACALAESKAERVQAAAQCRDLAKSAHKGSCKSTNMLWVRREQPLVLPPPSPSSGPPQRTDTEQRCIGAGVGEPREGS